MYYLLPAAGGGFHALPWATRSAACSCPLLVDVVEFWRGKEVITIKDFNDFCTQCAKNGLPEKISETVQGLTEQQAVDTFKVFLQILREYHEWLQRDHQ